MGCPPPSDVHNHTSRIHPFSVSSLIQSPGFEGSLCLSGGGPAAGIHEMLFRRFFKLAFTNRWGVPSNPTPPVEIVPSGPSPDEEIPSVFSMEVRKEFDQESPPPEVIFWKQPPPRGWQLGAAPFLSTEVYKALQVLCYFPAHK